MKYSSLEIAHHFHKLGPLLYKSYCIHRTFITLIILNNIQVDYFPVPLPCR